MLGRRPHDLPGVWGLDALPTTEQLEAMVANPALSTLFVKGAVPSSMWSTLNREFFQRRPEVQLYLPFTRDLTCLAALPHVRRLSVMGFEVTGVDTLAELPALEVLRLGLRNLESFEILDRLASTGLTELQLSGTRSKRLSLAPLRRFKGLRKLYVEGHREDLEVLGELSRLQDLTLRSINDADLAFVQKMPRLWSLDLKLGGVRDLDVIGGLARLKYLELWRVNGVSKLDVVRELPALQYLFLQSLSRLTKLPDFSRNRALRRIYLHRLTRLKEVSSLARAPALAELHIVDGKGFSPEMFLPVLKRKNLKRASAGFGSTKLNDRFEALAKKHGVRPVTDAFRFRGAPGLRV
jgi:hypothetical protein